jgi:hypothetical protein
VYYSDPKEREQRLAAQRASNRNFGWKMISTTFLTLGIVIFAVSVNYLCRDQYSSGDFPFIPIEESIVENEAYSRRDVYMGNKEIHGWFYQPKLLDTDKKLPIVALAYGIGSQKGETRNTFLES